MFPTSLDAIRSGRHSRHIARRLTESPAEVSRRGFLGRVAGGAGVLVGASLLGGRAAMGAPHGGTNPAPKPIPGGFTVDGITFHVTSFGDEPAVITDFQGMTGVADVQGTGTATNPDGSTETLLFDTDMRFFKGVYVAQDGRTRRATFGFV